jgi:protein-tyrosine-phosphatase
MTSFLRSTARQLRWMPQRLLHPLRRRRAARALLQRDPPGALLFVCHGNICRSPFAQELLLARLPPGLARRVRVLSAGFIGANRPSPPEALSTALRWGVDLTAHRSRVLAPEGVAGADVVFVMDELQQSAICRRFGRGEQDVLVLGDLDPAPVERRRIRDPVEQSAEVFAESYARIERCIDVLLGLLVLHVQDRNEREGAAMAEAASGP